MTTKALDAQYRTAVAAMQDLERRLAATRKDDPQRDALKADLATAVEAVRSGKESIKQANTRRHFAGFGSPLHAAIVARLEPQVAAQLEADALARQDERDLQMAERRAARAAASPEGAPALPPAPPPPPPPAPPPAAARRQGPVMPEVYTMRPAQRPSPAPAVRVPPLTPARRPPQSAPTVPSRRAEVANAFADARRR